MTRLLTTGYETGDLAEVGISTIGIAATLTVVSTTPTPRAGNYCLKAQYTGAGNWNATYKALSLPAVKTEVWVRFAFLSHLINAAEIGIGQWFDGSAAAQVALTYSSGDGLLRLYRGGPAGTLLATSSSGFAQDTWHCIDWRTQLLTTTTGTSEVWIDGTRVINFSGDNSNTATLNLLTLQLGNVASTSGPGTNAFVAFDDIAVNDVAGSINNARIGDGRVILLTPSGSGSSTVLARGGTDTGANYSQVNELPPSLTQYVGSSTAADRDLYAMADISGLTIASINVVEEIVLAQNSDAGAGSLGLTIKSGATTNEATAQALGAAAAYYVSRWETDPNTSAAWTASAINALEAGVTVR